MEGKDLAAQQLWKQKKNDILFFNQSRNFSVLERGMLGAESLALSIAFVQSSI